MTTSKKGSEWMDKVIVFVVDLKEQPPMAQMGVGAGFGTVSGYFMTKGGRMVAATVGISFLLAQYAIHKGYIKIDQPRVEKDLKKLQKAVVDGNNKAPKLSNSFLNDNRWILGGFAAGMLIGFSIA